MPGRLTLLGVFAASLVAVLAATTGIVLLWVAPSFPARYSSARAPTLLYAYNNSDSTATCTARYKTDRYYTWVCADQSRTAPTGAPASSASQLSASATVLFSLVSSVGGSGYNLRTVYGQQYLPPPTATAAATVNAGATSASGSASGLPALLRGSIVSVITPAPTATVFDIQLPQPKVSGDGCGV